MLTLKTSADGPLTFDSEAPNEEQARCAGKICPQDDMDVGAGDQGIMCLAIVEGCGKACPKLTYLASSVHIPGVCRSTWH